MGWFTTKDPVLTDEKAQALSKAIGDLTRQVEELRGKREAGEEVISLQDKITALQKQLTTLEIQKAKKDEDHERAKRETEHKVGLVRKEFDEEKKTHAKELELSKKEAKLDLREENLNEERKRFEDQMKFIRDRFEDEQKASREILGKILNRLPDVTAHFERSMGQQSDAEVSVRSTGSES